MRFSVNLDRSMKESLPSPPGFDLSVQDISLRNIGDSVKNENKAELAQIMQNKAWTLIKNQISSVFMSMFMFYMIGSNLSIFTIIFTIMFLFTPVKSLLNVKNEFKAYEVQGASLAIQKLAYLAIHFSLLGLAIYKFANMGLIPVNPYDWVRLLPYQEFIEFIRQLRMLLLQFND